MEKTRVNCFALFLLLVLLTGCSSTSGTSATVEELPEEAPSYVTELKVPTVEEVQEINEYVNGLISYGVGPQVEGRPITEEDYLEFGTGDCGIYCYLFITVPAWVLSGNPIWNQLFAYRGGFFYPCRSGSSDHGRPLCL